MDILQVTMDKLFDTKQVKSWTTHENSHGIVLTIRFSKDGSHIFSDPTGSTNSEPVYKQRYVKESNKQALRSMNRYNPKSQKKHPMATRLDSVENNRSANFVFSPPDPISPDVVVTDVDDDQSMHERSCSDHAGFHSAELHDSPQCPTSLNSPSIETQLQLDDADKQCISFIPPVKDSLPNKDILDSDSDSTCDDVSENGYDGYCSDMQCSYRTVPVMASKTIHRKKNTYSVCSRCKLPRDNYRKKDNLVVCEKCRDIHGKHKRHKHFLKPTVPESLQYVCPNGEDCQGLNSRDGWHCWKGVP